MSDPELRPDLVGLSNLRISGHPLIQHKVTLLADRTTETGQFRELVRELTHLLLYESTADLPLRDKPFETPLEAAVGKQITSRVALVPILRAGLGMIEGARDLLPAATVYHLGIYRDEETHNPVSYYHRFPEQLPEDVSFVLDPMLATAGSAISAVTELKAHGATNIKYVGLIAAPEGVREMIRSHPDVPVHVALVDRELDPDKYIRPGLGDAGDRLYGTGA